MDKYFIDQPIDRKLAEKPVTGNEPDAEILNINECHFWANRLEEDKNLPPHTVCMIDGGHYIIEDENDKSPFRGFGGDKFVIKFNDGTEVTTTNLWYQGKPQGYWKEKFPNNANFDWKWKNIGETNYLVKK